MSQYATSHLSRRTESAYRTMIARQPTTPANAYTPTNTPEQRRATAQTDIIDKISTLQHDPVVTAMHIETHPSILRIDVETAREFTTLEEFNTYLRTRDIPVPKYTTRKVGNTCVFEDTGEKYVIASFYKGN